MSKFGSDLFAKEVHADKIYWKEFEPPLSQDPGGGDPPVPTLAAVLDAGSDANDVAITNLGDMTGTGDLSTSGSITSTKLDTAGPGIVCNKLQATHSIVPASSGTGTIGNFRKIEADELDANNTLEARAAYSYMGRIEHFTTEPTPRTAAVLSNGEFFCKSISVSDPYNDAVPKTVISEIANQGVVATTGLVSAGVNMQTPVLTMTHNTPPAVIDCTGGASNFEGSSTSKTAFTNCDFSSSTNVFGPDAEDRFTYGCVFRPSTTYRKEFDQEDGYAQVLSENLFTYTIPTTNPDHANQIAELYFFVEEYGYGNNHACLFMSDEDGQNRSIMTNRGGDVKWQTSQGPFIGRDDRKTGSVIAKMYLHGMPTDGVRRRIYPGFRSNDPAPGPEDEGRFIIEAGQSTTAGAPGPCILIVKPIPSKAGTYPNFREVTA